MSTERKADMLKRIVFAPRTERSFTEGDPCETLAAPHIARYLADMVADGWITQYEDYYFPTEAGKALASKQPEKAEPRTWCACSTTGTYKPKAWPVRDGGDQHQQYHSRGV